MRFVLTLSPCGGDGVGYIFVTFLLLSYSRFEISLFFPMMSNIVFLRCTISILMSMV